MKTAYQTIVLGIVMGACGMVSAAEWFRGWEYRQQITVYSNQVSGTEVFTNFPVLITGGSVQSDLWRQAQAGGGDLVFTASDGVTKLAHEVERYDAGSSQLCAWVQVPRLSSASNTILYLYYGRPGVTNVQNAGAL